MTTFAKLQRLAALVLSHEANDGPGPPNTFTVITAACRLAQHGEDPLDLADVVHAALFGGRGGHEIQSLENIHAKLRQRAVTRGLYAKISHRAEIASRIRGEGTIECVCGHTETLREKDRVICANCGRLK